jgi:hypothetical protein
VGKPEGKRVLGTTRLRWEGNIKSDLRERFGGHGLDRAGLSRDKLRALLNVAMNFLVP